MLPQSCSGDWEIQNYSKTSIVIVIVLNIPGIVLVLILVISDYSKAVEYLKLLIILVILRIHDDHCSHCTRDTKALANDGHMLNLFGLLITLWNRRQLSLGTCQLFT